MELIVTPPRVAVRFRTSLVHSLMTVVGLLHVSNRLEGLSDWIRKAEARIDADTLTQLQPAAMFSILAAGLQGYLIDSVPLDSPANSDFDALIAHLNQLDTLGLQKVAFQAMQESLWRINILPPEQNLPMDREHLRDIISHAYENIANRWEPPLATPMAPHRFADLMLDADALHEQLINALRMLWEGVYQDQFVEDGKQHKEAFTYHHKQQSSEEFRTIFREVTGRTLPEWLRQHLPNLRYVDFVPASHVGAHITFSMLGNKWWIGFNANLVPAQHGNQQFSPALYPVLKALADETRLKMVSLLTEGTCNVGEMAEALNLTQSTASRHLSLLAKTDILETRRDGTMRYYSLNRAVLQEVSEQISHLARNLPNKGETHHE